MKKVRRGAVNTEAILEIIDPSEMVSIITKESADNLGPVQGKDVYAAVKASNVMIATD